MFVTSCDENKIIYVAPMLANCDSNSEQKCMQIKENKEDEWTLFNNEIEGFEYQEGSVYKLEVTVSKVKNSTGDTSGLKYKLSKLIYKEPVEDKIEAAQGLSGAWKVASMVGMDSLIVQPTLTFKEGKVSGNAGCNNYSAGYTVNNDSISIGLAMATKMYCTHMNIEKAFFDCLQKAAYFKIKDGYLLLYSDQSEELLSSFPEN